MAVEERDLAVVVPADEVDAAVETARAEGVFDPERPVHDWDGEHVAVPVTSPPERVAYREVVRDGAHERRDTLAAHLRDRGWSDDEIERAPGSWAVVGSVLLADFDGVPRPDEVGEALLDLHGEADTVLDRGGIEGAHREPDVTVVAGDGDTETVHREHGTAYALDLAEVMFSPGNKAERRRMGEVVADAGRDRDGGDADAERGGNETTTERVLDMFAGIGYFALPMARAGATVTAIERNPASFRYLIENARLNDVDDRLHPYRGDCADVVPALAEGAGFDRLVMGHYDAHEYLDVAMDAIATGGRLHLHAAAPENLAPDRALDRLERAAADAGRSLEAVDPHEVKTYSEGVVHLVVDATVE